MHLVLVKGGAYELVLKHVGDRRAPREAEERECAVVEAIVDAPRVAQMAVDDRNRRQLVLEPGAKHAQALDHEASNRLSAGVFTHAVRPQMLQVAAGLASAVAPAVAEYLC